MLGRFFHSNEEAWRERKYVWMNTTKKSIYSRVNYMLQHEKRPIYVFLYAFRRWCLSSCVCARENFERFALNIFSLTLRMALVVCVLLFNAWTFCCGYDWLASLISFTFSGRENSTLDRKKSLRVLCVGGKVSTIFPDLLRKWNFTQNVGMFNMALINNKKFYDKY